MKILHVIPCADEANGVYQVARMLSKKQSADGNEALVVTLRGFSTSTFNLHLVDEVYVHGMWLPSEWRACLTVLRSRVAIGVPRLIRMTHGSLSPVYLEHQGKWKKRLVAPIERWLFSKTDRVAVTGEWETEWCRKWGLKNEIETVDVKQFFRLDGTSKAPPRESPQASLHLLRSDVPTSRPLHILYLGHIHPLKGVRYLEQAVDEINRTNLSDTLVQLRIVSAHFGAELERDWEWCDVLCLPTLSENFGLVVAEALERGKRVVVTDGAPAWEPPMKSAEVERKGEGEQWRDRLVYLRGYREGTDEERVRLLKEALIFNMV